MNDKKYAAELMNRAKTIKAAARLKNPFDFKGCERKAKRKGIESPGAYCATIDRAKNVTDRALRYRAQKASGGPKGLKNCLWCGSNKKLMVGHIDGREENTNPENLGPTCRSCNTKTANAMKKAGMGRRTKQRNPARKNPAGGATTLGAYINAIQSMKGEYGGNMSLSDAVALIQATPASRRSRFAKEVWQRRQRRASEVPF